MPPAGKDLTIILRSRPRALIEAVVVHTGYQDVKRKSSTGSFDEVNTDLLSRRVSTNILDRIDGVTSGVLFNKNVVPAVNQSAITIRGRSTIYANPNPLIVVDNFPYPGDINNINPEDVESITVLKDAAAAAIWGAFSGNGVIVITTKKGKVSEQPRFSFTSSLTAGARPDLYYQKILSPADYIDIENYLWNNHFYDNLLLSPQYPALSPAVEIFAASRNHLISSSDSTAQIDALKNVDTRRDLGKYFYRPSLNTQYTLNVTGGDTKDQYYVSAGYDQNLSNLVRNKYDRVTLTGNNDYNLIPGKLELNTGLAFTASTSYLNNPGGVPFNYPYAQLADAQGHPLSVPFVLRTPYVDTVGMNEPGGVGLLDWHFSPLAEMQNANNKIGLTDYRINIGLRYSILRQLDFRAFYQFGRGDSDFVSFHSLKTYYTRNLINSFTQASGGSLTFPIPRGGILNEIDDGYTANNVRFQLSYIDSIGDGMLNALGGIEVRDIGGKNRTSWQYGYDPDLGTAMPVDYLHTYPEYTTGVPIQLPYQDGTVATSERYLSYYLNSSYSWRGRYIVSASARRDESNIFGVQANQKGVPLWSGGLAWDISKEKFYHVQGLPFLKLRVTDGYTGNVDRNLSAYTTANINTGVNNYGLTPAFIINPANPNLRWERINIVNAGVDFATGPFGGTLEYYVKSGIDLIGPSPIDPTTGFSVFEGNAANMRAHGLDLMLHYDHSFRSVHWNSIVLLSYVQDKVTDYKANLGSVQNYLNPATINPLVGKPLYSIYALRWGGLDPESGNPQGYYKGMISQDYGAILSDSILTHLVYKGPANPRFFGSWRNDFYWKQWGLSFMILYKFGYVFRRNSIFYSSVFVGSSQGYPDYDHRWQQKGDEKRTNVPSMVYSLDPNRDEFYQNSEALIVKADHIRLQDVELSYDLDKRKHPRLPLPFIRFYVYANNLGILWKANHAGVDPDYVFGRPQPRTVAFGVKLDY